MVVPGARGRSRRISSVDTMVRRLPTSSCTASPNLGQERRSIARLLRRALASLRIRVVVVILTLFPSSLNLYSITFLIPLSSGPITCFGGNKKSKSSLSSSSSSPHRSLLGCSSLTIFETRVFEWAMNSGLGVCTFIFLICFYNDNYYSVCLFFRLIRKLPTFLLCTERWIILSLPTVTFIFYHFGLLHNKSLILLL